MLLRPRAARSGSASRDASLAVRFALALSGDDAETARRGFESLTAYLASLHRFGPDVGAALLPMYGAAEFPQAFARLAAVRGATCALRVGARRAYVESIKKKKTRTELVRRDRTRRCCCHRGGAASAVSRARRRRRRDDAHSFAGEENAGRKRGGVDSKRKRDARDALDLARHRGGGRRVRFLSERGSRAGGRRKCRAFEAREKHARGVPARSVRGAHRRGDPRVAQLGAATGACPRVQPKEDENASGGWRVLQASVASSHPKGSAEDDLRGVLKLRRTPARCAGTGPRRGKRRRRRRRNPPTFPSRKTRKTPSPRRKKKRERNIRARRLPSAGSRRARRGYRSIAKSRPTTRKPSWRPGPRFRGTS